MKKPKAPKAGNAFAKIRNSLQSLDEIVDLDGVDSLTGKFIAPCRKPNGKGKKCVTGLKAKFIFKDDILKDAGFGKIQFRDKLTNTPFGEGVNPRRAGKTGNKKFDFLDNGDKIVELSVEPRFLKAFEQGRKLKGFFRVSLDDDFITMSRKNGDGYKDNIFMKADFETGLLA